MKKLLFVPLLVLLVPFAFAQPKEQKLRVATRLIKPFVYEAEAASLPASASSSGKRSPNRLNAQSEFVVKPTVKELLDAVKSKNVALGIAAISITADREMELDFSQPMFDAGLQILTPVQGGRGGFVEAIMTNLLSTTVLLYVLGVAFILLLMAHLVWFFERRNSTGMLTHRAYFPGIFEACWWAASTLATQADQMPRAAMARIIAVLWMFMSVVFIAYFTAAVTSSLTVQQLRGDINGPEDLPGKRVGSIKGSTSVEYLRQRNVEPWNLPRWRKRIRRSKTAKSMPWFTTRPSCSITRRMKGKAKYKPLAQSFARKTTASSFPPTARIVNRSTKRY